MTHDNASARELFRVRVCDLACGDVVFARQILSRSRQTVGICPDPRGRGHILMFDTRRNFVERRDLRSPTTINLAELGLPF